MTPLAATRQVVLLRGSTWGVAGASPWRTCVPWWPRWGALSGTPNQAWLRASGLAGVDPGLLAVGSRELYLWCPDGILASPAADLLARAHPGLVVTSRNLGTVTRLVQLLRA